MGDFKGESLILRLLRKIFVLAAPKKLIEEAEKSFKGVILIEGNIALKVTAEEGICTEDAECNRRGESLTFKLFVIVIMLEIEKIPLYEKRRSNRLSPVGNWPAGILQLKKEGMYNKNPQHITMPNTSPQKHKEGTCYKRDKNVGEHITINEVYDKR
ncbi:MAG: hypothetical protein KZQ70_13140 [gamma proteobacterium symbiont of Lucinoma myriamae]|nr:hypothetical protein [gamma proteobacterium symbiont of Lucinoma myriamae]